MRVAILRRGNQAAAGFGGVAGFDSNRLVIVVFTDGQPADEEIGGMQFAFLREIGRRHGMNRDGSEFPELLMLPCPSCQNDQVSHGGIVRFFMQAVRVDKMCGAHAEFGRIVIHQRDKACDTA